MKDKYSRLISILREMDGAVVAYSGGVDSSLLLKACKDTMGEKVIAVIADSLTMPRIELSEALDMAESIGVTPVVVKTDEFSDINFCRNDKNRCYYCKDTLFKEIKKIADANNISHILYGGNLDDETDYRPGIRAAGENEARAPLCEAGLTKSEVRILSKKLNLKTWDKPAQACLSSRIPYGVSITMKRLQKIEKAEYILRELGFIVSRVRLQDDHSVRIEIEKTDFNKILDNEVRQKIVSEIKKLGFTYIALDLEGFRSGSMNEVLPTETDYRIKDKE